MKRVLGANHPNGLPELLAAMAMMIVLAGCGSADKPTEETKQPPTEETPSTEEPSAEKPSTEETAAEEPGEKVTSAQEILEKMADVYRKTPAYADKAQIRLLATAGDQKIDDSRDIVVALQRPNKLRLDISKVGEGDEEGFRAVVVCDGKRYNSYLSALPDQVVDREAPSTISLESIFVDRVFGNMMMRGVGQLPPQLALLLSDSALKGLTEGAEAPALEQSGEIEGHPCYRVKMKSGAGPATYWIDEKSFALRRIVLPTNDLRQILPLPGPIDSISLTIDFHGATLGEVSDANAFRFELPEDVQRVKFFAMPSPEQLLGKKVPDFKIFGIDGNEITPQTLEGKIAVMDFWATWCSPCREGMPHLQEVYEKYKDNDKIAFLVVSVDDPKMDREKLISTLAEWKVTIPLARDLESNAGIGLRFDGIPTTVVIDAKGTVQLAHSGVDPELNVKLPQTIDKLLAGEDVYQEALDEYIKQRKLREERMEAAAKAADVEPGSTVEEHSIPQARIAPQSAPKNFKLMPAWKCDELRQPGNILAVTGEDGKTRLLVVNSWKSVAEVSLDGKLIADHALELEQPEAVGLIRTAVDAEGKRYFALMANAQQRVHIFDQEWKPLLRYPEDALENKHAGIADVQLGDADGDGKIKAYVGYWGLVGIQAVSLQGERVWFDRSITNVLKIAIGQRDQDSQQNLYCVNNSGSLAVLSAEGKSIGKVTVEKQTLQWATNADLAGDGQLQWCGLSAPQSGDAENTVIGFNLKGETLWSKTIPAGIHRTLVEPIIAGNFSGADTDQWILIGPDGSVNIVTADGEEVDQFNFGAAINGLATATVDGRPLLIISSAEGMQAWFVEI